MYKLKTREIAIVRAKLIEVQKGNCALCGLPLATRVALDHHHSTGIVRGVLHSGCNSLLGPIENRYRLYAVPDLQAFSDGLGAYLRLHSTDQTGLLHPTFFTPEEKKERAKAKRKVKK